MTEYQMTGKLAQAMQGDTGEALRMYLVQTFQGVINQFLDSPNNPSDVYRGMLACLRLVTNGLEGMPNAFKMMQEQEERDKP